MIEINNKSDNLPASGRNPSASLFLSTLTNKQKSLYYKVLREVYNDLLPVKIFAGASGIISLYWLAETIRKRHDISCSQLAMLTLLYYCTHQGTQPTTLVILASLSPDSSSFLNNNVIWATHAHYIERYRTLKGQPHSKGAKGKYMNITPSGIALMRTINKELSDLIYSVHVPDPVK